MLNLQDYLTAVQKPIGGGNLSKGLSLSDTFKPFLQNNIDFDVAIIGVNNDTNGVNNKGTLNAADNIRRELYSLRGNLKNIYVTDLGNLKPEKVKDAYFALEELVAFLIGKKVIPIIIGGSQDFNLPLFKGLKECCPKINFLCVDQTLDVKHSDDFDHQNYLKPVLNDDALNAFNLIAYQNYLYDETLLTDYTQFPITTIRMGELRKNMHNTEPLFRDADFVSFDMGAVRQSDAPGVRYGSPNGLFGEELCQLSRFAGFSDRISLFSLFETNPECDINAQTSKLAAQAIWHFLDGLDKRYKDYPVRGISSYKKFVVQQTDIDSEIVFYNNPSNNRWWIEVNRGSKIIVSCTYDDYKYARSNKIPDIYYKWSK